MQNQYDYNRGILISQLGIDRSLSPTVERSEIESVIHFNMIRFYEKKKLWKKRERENTNIQKILHLMVLANHLNRA